jgi:chemotaxis protein histidine kinase CheA
VAKATKGKNYEVIVPPSKLADRVSKGGPDPAEAIARADNTVQEMKKDYKTWLREDIDRLMNALAALKASNGAEDRTAKAGTLFSASFDIKGQAGTFGFTVLSRVAKSLCKLLEEKSSIEIDDFGVIVAHVDAMRASAIEQTDGTPSRISLEVVAALEGIVAKRLNR